MTLQRARVPLWDFSQKSQPHLAVHGVPARGAGMCYNITVCDVYRALPRPLVTSCPARHAVSPRSP